MGWGYIIDNSDIEYTGEFEIGRLVSFWMLMIIHGNIKLVVNNDYMHLASYYCGHNNC
jgi:hypothetical protein